MVSSVALNIRRGVMNPNDSMLIVQFSQIGVRKVTKWHFEADISYFPLQIGSASFLASLFSAQQNDAN